MHAFAWLTKLLRNERGNALIVGASTLPLVIGAAAIGVDTIQVSLAKRQLQRTADSAALAGAYAIVQSQSVATSVNHDLALNNDVTLSGSPVIENAPTTGSYAGNPRAVRVVLSAERSVPFVSFFTGSTMAVQVEATAAAVYVGEFCMVSLETSAVDAGVTFSGSTSLDLGCGVATNSRASNAITAGGSSSVIASPIAAVGGVPASASYANGTTLLPYSPAQTDPFADLPMPAVPSGCSNQAYRVLPNNQNQQALSPVANYSVPGFSNVYCYRGLDINGPLDIPANSLIIVDGSTLDFGAQARVTGTGVTFLLTSSNAASNPSSIATLNMNGQAELNISAPSGGTYEGVLMYQDRRIPYGDSYVNGNSASRFEGGFYFPNRRLTFNGNTGMRTECLQLVARRLNFTGNSRVQNTCPTNGGASAFDATFVRLVG